MIAQEWLALAALALATATALPAWWQALLPARTRALLAAGAGGLLLLACAVAALVPGAPLEGRVVPDLAVALATLLAVVGGGPVTAAVFELVDARDDDERTSVRRAGEVLRGGAWIGGLERAAVTATLVGGWPEGVAVVLAVKGLGRYPELRSGDSPGAAERFIIGTFTSVLWAVACAGAATLLRP